MSGGEERCAGSQTFVGFWPETATCPTCGSAKAVRFGCIVAHPAPPSPSTNSREPE